jgi:Reverse transcriptase (RNA-dependent DNA polymerase)
VDILLGDFNVTLRSEDSSAPRAPLAVLNAVEDLLSHLGLADIAPEGAAHTFHWDKQKPKPGSARLDRVYAPVESSMAPTQLPTQDPGLSDHSPVLCSLLTGLTAKASPLPRLRVEGITPGQLHAYNMIVDELPTNPTVGQWGAMKRQLLAVSRAFHKATRSQQPPPSSVSPEELSAAVQRAAKIARIPVDMARELPGPILSSWVKGSKARAAIKTLRHLEPDLPQHDPRVIMSILEEYWSSIFTARAVVTGEPLHNLLPKAAWPSLQRRFTLEDVSTALCKTKRGSAPGPDGIPYEFYKAFPQLLEKLTSLFNHCYQDGVIPSSWRTAILCTLPKEGKDTTLVSNYRPIALLCTDFKLMMSILASRLQGELQRLNYFPRHQTGFLQGRSVYEAIFKVAHWTMDLGSTTILLDFEKAYDRVQHSWLGSAWRLLGSHPSSGHSWLCV